MTPETLTVPAGPVCAGQRGPAVATVCRRLALVGLPNVLVIGLGCSLAGLGPVWPAIALGGLLALPLSILGSAALLLTSQSGFTPGLIAANASLLVRIGGIALCYALLKDHAHITAVLVAMAVCQVLTLVMELLTAIRPVSSRPAEQEAARA